MSTAQQEQRKRYRVGETVGFITYPDGENKTLKMMVVLSVEGRGMKVRDAHSGKHVFAYYNQIEKIELEEPPKRPVVEHARTRPVVVASPWVDDVRAANIVPVEISRPAPLITPPPAAPKPSRDDALADFDDLIAMSSDVADALAVRQAELMQQLKAAKTERDLIDRDIEAIEGEHSKITAKVDVLRKLRSAR